LLCRCSSSSAPMQARAFVGARRCS